MIFGVAFSAWENSVTLVVFALAKAVVCLILPAFFILPLYFSLMLIRWIKRSNRGDDFSFILVAYALATLGIVIGQLLGSSRAPAVAQFLPASLSFVGGFSVYILANDFRKAKFVSVVLISFSSFLFIGSLMGIKERENFERHIETARREREAERIDNLGSQLITRSDVERFVNFYRFDKGLKELPYDYFFDF